MAIDMNIIHRQKYVIWNNNMKKKNSTSQIIREMCIQTTVKKLVSGKMK